MTQVSDVTSCQRTKHPLLQSDKKTLGHFCANFFLAGLILIFLQAIIKKECHDVFFTLNALSIICHLKSGKPGIIFSITIKLPFFFLSVAENII